MVHLKMVPMEMEIPNLEIITIILRFQPLIFGGVELFDRSSQCTQCDSIHPSGIAQIINWMVVPSRNRS